MELVLCFDWLQNTKIPGALKVFTTNCRSSVLCALPPVCRFAQSGSSGEEGRLERMRTAHTPIQLCCCASTTPSCCCSHLESWMRSREPPGAGSRAAARLGRIAGDGATTTRHQHHSCPIFQVIFVHKRVNSHPNVPQTVLDLMSRRYPRCERFTGFYAVLHGKHRQSSAAVRYPASHIYLSGNLMTIWQIVRKSAGQIYHTKFGHNFSTAQNFS